MEKHRLEDLKKMTMEELKAISRPLEVGEVIQEGDWFPWPDANGYMFANTMIGVKLNERDWYRPTNNPSDEIKLGWYQHENSRLFRVVFVRDDDWDYSVIGHWEKGNTSARDKRDFNSMFTYLGTTLPEPGEWVDPGEVKLSELPMRARFRHGNDDWHEGFLDGRLVMKDDSLGYSKHNGGWYSECQVWRPSK